MKEEGAKGIILLDMASLINVRQVYNAPSNINLVPLDAIYARGSCWRITINTNKSTETVGPLATRRIGENLLNATRIIFDKDLPGSHFSEVWKIYRDLGPSPEYTVTPNVEVSSSRTETFNRIHLHVDLKWVHHGKIRLDYRLVRKLYKEYMCPSDGSRECYGVNNIYLHIVRTNCYVPGYVEKGIPLASAPVDLSTPFTRLPLFNVTQEFEGPEITPNERFNQYMGRG